MIWVSVRLKQQVVTAVSVITAALAIAGTLEGIGPFIAAPTLNESLITVEVFVAVNAVILLVLNAAILERREKEDSLRVARDHLELVVRERTRELEEKNKELERRNKELASFGYAASHDLQEPLRKIQTFSDQLMQNQNNFTELEKGIFERIRSAAARMKQLIENLLTFSRVGTGNNMLLTTNLNTIIHEVKQELAEKIEKAGATVIVEALPSLPVVPFQMQQLFTNLLNNAIKFRRNGVPLMITITHEKVTGAAVTDSGLQPGLYYHHICVADNGIGFDQKYAEKIFEIFQRLHGQAEFEGTGIGLAICKKIVENHGGTILAEGENERGASFHVYLPAGNEVDEVHELSAQR